MTRYQHLTKKSNCLPEKYIFIEIVRAVAGTSTASNDDKEENVSSWDNFEEEKVIFYCLLLI